MQNNRTSERVGLVTRLARSWRLASSSDRWDVRRYLIAAVWGALFLSFTPAALQPVLPFWSVVLVMAVVIVGGCVAAIGRYLNENLWLELPGAMGLMAGLAFYQIVNVILIIFAGTNIAQTALTAFVMTFPLQRLVVLLPKWVEAVR